MSRNLPNRRQFIKASSLLGAGLSLTGFSRKSPARPDKPNILILLVDQDRYPMHTPPLKRPIVEHLKKTGIEFHNTFASFPLCSPSRATILTGKYPHQVGIFTNVDFSKKNPSLSPRVPNLGRIFSKAGYRTAYFGKWHLTRRAHSSGEIKKYGFDEMHISNQLVAFGSDLRVIENTARWLKKQKNKNQPWLCICAPINPHDICLFPSLVRFYGKIPEYPLSPPPNFTKHPGEIYPGFGEYLKVIEIRSRYPKTEAGWREYLRFYCYLTELVDRQLLVVLEALEESGQMKNTIIIYTSDHGEMGGSHGLVNKGMAMYEENLRVPLIISIPGKISAPGDYYGLVSNIDLVPTICRLAGVSWPERLLGRDLSPLFEGKKVGERELIFSEGQAEYQKTPPWRGLRTKKYKYWHYLDGREFLFDLEKDLLEINNLAQVAEYKDLLEEFRERVRRFRRDTKDPFPEFL